LGRLRWGSLGNGGLQLVSNSSLEGGISGCLKSLLIRHEFALLVLDFRDSIKGSSFAGTWM
jgi:hypothetical protein